MSLEIVSSDRVPDGADVVGVAVFNGCRPATSAAGTDVGASLGAGWLAARGFDGKLGETCAAPGPGGTTVVAIGLGDEGKVDCDVLRRAAACFVLAAGHGRVAGLDLLQAAPAGLDRVAAAQAVAEGALLASYRFIRYKAEPKPARLERVAVIGGGGDAVRGVDRGTRVARAVMLARDLVNEPAGAMSPRALADVAREMAEREGLEVKILEEAAIEDARLGGLLGVGRGSAEPPRLIELGYDPPGARRSVVLVGKGITFDSGGLSIKTADGMETMKTDMSGAAAVLAAMSVLPALGPPVKVTGIIPAAENMPSGTATKPGDVLRIRNGKTVEVLNTDAEGRLVLADGLSLAVEREPDAIIDLATLTGACVVALGRSVAGLMGNDDALVERVEAAARRGGEAVWHLPLPDQYRKDIDSDVADVKNVAGRYGGALTAGLFLKEFVGDRAWVHLDIAGPARSDSDDGYVRKGGTGFGVRTLVELLTAFD